MPFDRRRKRYHNYHARKRGRGRFGGFKGGGGFGGGGPRESLPKQEKAFYVQRRGGEVRQYRQGAKYDPYSGASSGNRPLPYGSQSTETSSRKILSGRTGGISASEAFINSILPSEDYQADKEPASGPGAPASSYAAEKRRQLETLQAKGKYAGGTHDKTMKFQTSVEEKNLKKELEKLGDGRFSVGDKADPIATTWKDQDTDELSATLGQEKKEEWKGHAIGRTMGPSQVQATLSGHAMTPKVMQALRNAAKGQEHRTRLQMLRALGEIDPLIDDIYSDYH